MAKRKRRTSRRSRYSREMIYANPIAQENPLGTGTIIAIVAGVAALGAIVYVMSKPAAAAVPVPAVLPPTPVPTSTVRTANALDNYSVTLAPTAGGSSITNLTPAMLALNSTGATITGVFGAADGVSMVMTMTAPPGQTGALQTAVAQTAAGVGATAGTVLDTGIAVQ